ncbi:hypothetical protein [Streptomyces sp. NPDC059802]|uniref:hypothetical protein n=1 Tax=Streptomyces sp. NPDC059802 TaxID=3346952 RepID=UPI0036486AB0
MPASKAKQAITAERRTKLFQLRLQGVKYDDPRILALGYATPGSASKDVIRGLQARLRDEAAEVGVYRQQENERLDALLEAAWPRATEPRPIFNKDGEVIGEELDIRAVDTVLRLMDRRAKLNGLDMPVKAEVTGADGGPLAVSTADPDKLAAIIAATSRLDTDTPPNTATSTPADDEGEGTE